jgi:aminoglycoside phosphotransferase family enzyme/predicted kinase
MATELSETDHDRLIDALSAHLSDAAGEPAHIIKTHISSIILCGELAYKLKRPVKLPLINFSTVKARHRDCEEELRLNRRTAAQLYLHVLPITGSVKQPSVNGNGPTIDWVLCMKRFPQENLLSARLAAGTLEPEHIDKLADHLAEFQRTFKALNPHQLANLKPSEYWINESLNSLCTGSTSVLQTQIKQVHAQVQQMAWRLKQLQVSRQSKGCYRECHGDLHLANIVEIDGEFVAFDALEFNENLRNIDIINDFAFPFMDLMARRRPDLAWRLMSRVMELTGDYEGLLLLRFYALYRAIVRAKVAHLSQDSDGFMRYWSLSRSLAQPPHAPHLIFVSGFSGSGKSTVAQILVEQIGAVRLRADVERKRLFAHAADQPDLLYSDQASDTTYQKLAQTSQMLLQHHISVIVDATFLEQKHIDRFSALCNAPEWRATAFLCEANPSSMKSRITDRLKSGHDPSDATEEVLQRQLDKKSSSTVWPCQTILISNNGSLALLSQTVQAHGADLREGCQTP